MNSKELLEKLEDNGKDYLLPVRIYKQIKQDLDRLEQLEKCNQVLMNKTLEISNKLTMYKKALEKACERLDYSCPVEEELINDLNCENCNDTYKECWEKFFLKSVLEEE